MRSIRADFYQNWSSNCRLGLFMRWFTTQTGCPLAALPEAPSSLNLRKTVKLVWGYLSKLYNNNIIKQRFCRIIYISIHKIHKSKSPYNPRKLALSDELHADCFIVYLYSLMCSPNIGLSKPNSLWLCCLRCGVLKPWEASLHHFNINNSKEPQAGPSPGRGQPAALATKEELCSGAGLGWGWIKA